MKSYCAAVLILFVSRAPQGARGLKFEVERLLVRTLFSRAPQGARGLKSVAESSIKR